jgi:2,4-diketo-3-deoxy-L-fuconate hydrolase
MRLGIAGLGEQRQTMVAARVQPHPSTTGKA